MNFFLSFFPNVFIEHFPSKIIETIKRYIMIEMFIREYDLLTWRKVSEDALVASRLRNVNDLYVFAWGR